MAVLRQADLKKGNKRRLDQLKKLARKDASFMAVVDMYRYLDGDGEVVAYWYAWRDWSEHGGKDGAFNVLGPGYDQREMAFLSRRGLTRPS